jgi:hypothetical protein
MLHFATFVFSFVIRKSLSNLYKSPSNRGYYIRVSFGKKTYSYLFCG